MRRLLFIDRALPYLGPAFALVLGVVGLGRRSLDVDEAAVVAAAHGSFTDVVERAFSDDPARAGYIACSSPSSAGTTPGAGPAPLGRRRRYRRRSRRTGSAAGSAGTCSGSGGVDRARLLDRRRRALADRRAPCARARGDAPLERVVRPRGRARERALVGGLRRERGASPAHPPVAASALVAQLAAIAVGPEERSIFGLPYPPSRSQSWSRASS